MAHNAGALAKIRNWRHKQVAHRTAQGDGDSFHEENKMGLAEIEGALKQLDEAINHLSWNMLSIHNDTKSAFEGLVEEGKTLFSTAANALGRKK